MNYAERNGHLEILKWLNERFIIRTN
jgi:hypothetical protein